MLGYDYICMHGFPTTFSLCNSLNKRFPRIPVSGGCQVFRLRFHFRFGLGVPVQPNGSVHGNGNQN